ncbi:MAG: G-D-S-L family lipolytic protein, partial [Sphingobacteriaceae bacterium]
GIPYGVHPDNPIDDHYVLDQDEVQQVVVLIGEINKKITEIAAANDLAVADIHAFLNKVKSGYVYNGIAISSAFITGNAFSLDGIHLTPIGNAIVANLFIDAINKQYKADVPKVDITQYRGVKYPNS